MKAPELTDIISSLYIIQTQMRIAANVTVNMHGQEMATVDPRALEGFADNIREVAMSLRTLIPDVEITMQDLEASIKAREG